MTNIDGRFQDTYKDPRSVPIFNGVTERDFMEFSNMPDIEKEIEEGKKDVIAVQYAKFIREQGYGSVVRESIARLSLWLDVKLNAIRDKNDSIYYEYKQIKDELDSIKNQFEQVISSQTIDGEVKLARYSDFSKKTFASLKARLDYMESKMYLIDNGSTSHIRTLVTDTLRSNFEVNNVSVVSNDVNDYPLVFSDIKAEKRFYFERVGSV